MTNKLVNIFNPTPREWNVTNKSQAQIAAEKARTKLAEKKLVRIDSKTWVYVAHTEEPKPVKRYNYKD
jgi:hypothetical protein